MTISQGIRPFIPVVLTAIVLSNCATIAGVRPAPEETGRFEPQLTVGVPKEQPVAAPRTEGLSAEELGTITVYRKNIRAVVNVTALSVFQNRFKENYPITGTASGVIIDSEGHVVTNYHAIQGAHSLIITMYDGSSYRARVVGRDAEMDLAVLHFDPLGRQLTTVRVGDSDKLQIGQRVLALGNPFGLEGTLTSGIISGLRRPMQTASGFIVRNLIQTDAAINPGNSGGPLLNSSGELVGINVMILTPTGASVGIGFSIPSNAAEHVVRQILTSGATAQGWIQLTGLALDPQLARIAGMPQSKGLLITQVNPGGNAEAAGLRDGRDGRYVQRGLLSIPVGGDVIVAVGGQRVMSVADYFGTLESTIPGERISLTVLRGTRTIEIPVVLSPRPED